MKCSCFFIGFLKGLVLCVHMYILVSCNMYQPRKSFKAIRDIVSAGISCSLSHLLSISFAQLIPFTNVIIYNCHLAMLVNKLVIADICQFCQHDKPISDLFYRLLSIYFMLYFLLKESYAMLQDFEVIVKKEETDMVDSLRYSYQKLLTSAVCI